MVEARGVAIEFAFGYIRDALQGDIELIVADVTPGPAIVIGAAATHAKLGKCGQQKFLHCLGVLYGKIGVFESDHFAVPE
jgi:hypothetical protein